MTATASFWSPSRYVTVQSLPSSDPADLGFVPVLGVSDIGEAEVVLFGPEERDRVKPFTVAKNVACRRLSLALGHNKVFDADRSPVSRSGQCAPTKARAAITDVNPVGSVACHSDKR